MKKAVFVILMPLLFSQCTKDCGCIDKQKINYDAICAQIYAPVCGCDEKTYGNECEAINAGLTSWTQGHCKYKLLLNNTK